MRAVYNFGLVFWETLFAFLIFIAILIHETGHYAALKICGCKNAAILILYLVREGMTTDKAAELSSANRVFCALFCSALGIVSAFAALAGFVTCAALHGSSPIILVYYALAAGVIIQPFGDINIALIQDIYAYLSK